MSPYLVSELYEQIKRVVSKPLAITDPQGTPLYEKNDFTKTKIFRFKTVSRENSSNEVIDHPSLRSLSLYAQDKLLGYVVAEVEVEDIQTIQVIGSMADLIIQQFLAMHRPKPDTVDLLLNRLVYRSSTLEEGELDEQMAALGYRLDVQRVAVIFELNGFWHNYLQSIGQPLAEKQNLIAAKKRDIELSLVSFFSRNQDNIIGYIGNDRFLVLKDLSTTDFQKFCQLLQTSSKEITSSLKNINIVDVTIGIGSPSHSSVDLVESAQEALQALDIGKKLYGLGGVYRNEMLGILPLILTHNNTHKHQLASQLLAPIVGDAELFETLETFLTNNLNLTQTSEALSVHRNTVIYRLDKIQELLGKDPRQFEQAVELHLALLLQKSL